jgi:hypothetical protein
MTIDGEKQFQIGVLKTRVKLADLLAVAVLAAIVLLFFSPALLQPNKLIWSPLITPDSDIGSIHWLDMTQFAVDLRAGKISTWDPQMFLGRPRAGDTGTLFMYPLTLLFLFFPPALGFTVYFALHIFIGGLGTFLFLRKGYGVSSRAALFGGLAFTFTPKLLAHVALGHVGVVAGMALVPFVLLALKLAIDGSLLSAAVAGLVVALQMPTHVQEPYYTLILGSLFWFGSVVECPWRWRKGGAGAQKQFKWLLLVYGAWLVSFVLFAAIVVVPLLEIFGYNSRGNFTIGDAGYLAMTLENAAALILPSNILYGEQVIFLGLLSPVLALLGFLGSKFHSKWLWVGVIAFSAIYIFGTATPLFGLVFTYLPGAQFLRIPTRIWFFTALAVAILAGLGLDALAQFDRMSRPPQWRRLVTISLGIIVGVGVLALLIEWLLGRSLPTVQILSLLMLMIMAVAAMAWLNGRLSSANFQSVFILLLVMDLLPSDSAFIALRDPYETFLHPQTEMDYVARQSGVFRIFDLQSYASIDFTLAAEHGLETVDGYRSFQIKHALDLVQQAAGCVSTSYQPRIPTCGIDIMPPVLTEQSAQRLGALNVRYLISRWPLEARGFQLVFKDKRNVYEDLYWKPRTQVEPTGTATIVSRSAGEYALSIETDQPGELVVSETWLPGWKATINGGSWLPTHLTRGGLIGLALPAGQTTVQLSYRPLGWTIGWVISALAFVGLLVWCGWALWKRRSLP